MISALRDSVLRTGSSESTKLFQLMILSNFVGRSSRGINLRVASKVSSHTAYFGSVNLFNGGEGERKPDRTSTSKSAEARVAVSLESLLVKKDEVGECDVDA